MAFDQAKRGGGRREGGGNGKKRVTQQKNRLTVLMLWAGEGERFVFEYTGTIRNLQIILNTQKIPSSHPKKFLLNFPTQENPGIKNFKPKKSFDHPCHLEFRVSPPRLNRNPLNMDTLLLLRVCIVLREGPSLTHVSLNSTSLIWTPCQYQHFPRPTHCSYSWGLTAYIPFDSYEST